MNIAPHPEELYKGLCTSQFWLSNCEKLVFRKNHDGWSWDWRALILSQVAKSFEQSSSTKIKQKGFKTRKAAAERAQSLFGSRVDCSRFHTHTHKSYSHPDYSFEIIQETTGWTAFHLDVGFVGNKNSNNVQIFKTRKQAIDAMFDEDLQFLTKIK